jgi:hypothetical protein
MLVVLWSGPGRPTCGSVRQLSSRRSMAVAWWRDDVMGVEVAGADRDRDLIVAADGDPGAVGVMSVMR